MNSQRHVNTNTLGDFHVMCTIPNMYSSICKDILVVFIGGSLEFTKGIMLVIEGAREALSIAYMEKLCLADL